jgi:hypothetical protein
VCNYGNVIKHPRQWQACKKKKIPSHLSAAAAAVAVVIAGGSVEEIRRERNSIYQLGNHCRMHAVFSLT